MMLMLLIFQRFSFPSQSPLSLSKVKHGTVSTTRFDIEHDICIETADLILSSFPTLWCFMYFYRRSSIIDTTFWWPQSGVFSSPSLCAVRSLHSITVTLITFWVSSRCRLQFTPFHSPSCSQWVRRPCFSSECSLNQRLRCCSNVFVAANSIIGRRCALIPHSRDGSLCILSERSVPDWKWKSDCSG